MILSADNLKENSNLVGGLRSAYIVADFGNGGQERQLYNLLTNLPEDFKPVVIPWDFNPDDRYLADLKDHPGIVVYRLNDAGLIARVSEIRKLLKQTRVGFFHAYSFHLNFIVWMVCFATRIKAIGGIRSRLVLNRSSHGMLKFYLSFLFPFYKISNNYTCFKGLDKLSLAMAKVFTKTHFVHNGIDLERFHQDKTKPKQEGEPLKSISVGRLHPVKKVENIVDWVYRLKQQNILVSHQHAGHGPRLAQIEERIAELGLEKEFLMVGEIQDIPKLLQQAHLFVHAAQHEGCPNVVMEAMACGLPVLASNAGDTEHIVDQGQTGYVYQVDDQETMLKFSLGMMEDTNRLKEMGQLGATKALNKFGIAQYVEVTLQTYHKMGITI